MIRGVAGTHQLLDVDRAGRAVAVGADRVFRLPVAARVVDLLGLGRVRRASADRFDQVMRIVAVRAMGGVRSRGHDGHAPRKSGRDRGRKGVSRQRMMRSLVELRRDARGGPFPTSKPFACAVVCQAAPPWQVRQVVSSEAMNIFVCGVPWPTWQLPHPFGSTLRSPCALPLNVPAGAAPAADRQERTTKAAAGRDPANRDRINTFRSTSASHRNAAHRRAGSCCRRAGRGKSCIASCSARPA